jgi:hypothetical protein
VSGCDGSHGVTLVAYQDRPTRTVKWNGVLLDDECLRNHYLEDILPSLLKRLNGFIRLFKIELIGDESFDVNLPWDMRSMAAG